MRFDMSRAVGLGAITGLLAVIVLVDYAWQVELAFVWLVNMAVLALFLVILGIADKSTVLGVLIDERNKMSLTRLQTIIWTVVILSAITALGLARLRIGVRDPFAIAVPDQIWIALGITATALAGTPLIRSTKYDNSGYPDGGQLDRTAARLGTTSGDIALVGLIVVDPIPQDARWIDMFRGEEPGNAAALDVGKIQMFFFSMIVILVYSIAIWQLFHAAQTGGRPAQIAAGPGARPGNPARHRQRHLPGELRPFRTPGQPPRRRPWNHGHLNCFRTFG